jgi:ACT domain-containing protein
MAALMRTIRAAICTWRHAMAKVKQLTAALENRPGTLAHMAKVLADAKVNVLALLGSTELCWRGFL